MPDASLPTNDPALADEPRDPLPPLRIHHFLLWMTIQGLLAGGLVPDAYAFKLSYVHVHYWTSLLIWPAVSTAALVIVWWRLKSVLICWHPADSLIVIPRCVFFFNPVTFQAWMIIIQAERFDAFEESFAIWFAALLPPVLGLIAVLFVALDSLKCPRAWLVVLCLLAADFLRCLPQYLLELLDQDNRLLDYYDGFARWLNGGVTIALLISIVVAGWQSRTNKNLGWPRWWLIYGSALICLSEFVYWLQV